MCFNSMIVRLKVFVVAGGVNKIPPFQFYDSPIKRLENAEQAARIVSFNSMIVRLKETPENGVFGGENSFNSMIVRLKVCNSRPENNRFKRFQFYDSPIKRTEKS